MAFNDKIDLQELAQEDERLRSSNSGFQDQFAEMPAGDGVLRVRILPPGDGKKLFQYNRVHSANGRKVHCPRPLRNGKWDNAVQCPMCENYQHQWKLADKYEDEGRREEAANAQREARLLKPVERYYYNVIVRSMPVRGEVRQNVGPRILSIGKDLHAKILNGMIGDAEGPGLGNVTDLRRGYDLIIKKQMVGGFPRYSETCFAREPSPAGTPEEIERWSESLHDLAALRNPKPLADIERELAIHKKLIPDTMAFDEAAFAAKFQGPVSPETPTPVSNGGGGVGTPALASDNEVTSPKYVTGTERKAEGDDASCLADDGFMQEFWEK